MTFSERFARRISDSPSPGPDLRRTPLNGWYTDPKIEGNLRYITRGRWTRLTLPRAELEELMKEEPMS